MPGAAGAGPNNLRLADVDNDGYLVAHRQGAVSAWLNRGGNL